MTRAHFINSHVRDGASLAPGQGTNDAVWSFQIGSEKRRHGARLAPSLRVASQCGACGVVGLANGTTIRCTLRLASIRIGKKRVTRVLMK